MPDTNRDDTWRGPQPTAPPTPLLHIPIPMPGHELNKHEERGHHERHDHQDRGKKPDNLEDLLQHMAPLLAIRMSVATPQNLQDIGKSPRHWWLPKTLAVFWHSDLCCKRKSRSTPIRRLGAWSDIPAGRHNVRTPVAHAAPMAIPMPDTSNPKH
jgi:hypothetical protein